LKNSGAQIEGREGKGGDCIKGKRETLHEKPLLETLYLGDGRGCP